MKKQGHRASSSTSSNTERVPKTQVLINVYDLLPPGRLSSVLWTLGSSLLHTGVVIKEREYAYGGHDQQGLTGVYWTQPRTEPTGATFKIELLHGFTMRTDEEIAAAIQQVSEEYLGPSYNLLSKNCNHFTNALCQKLTGQPAPAWLNRAAGIGIAMPCVVPREWVAPPDYETAEGELIDGDQETDERARMLPPSNRGECQPAAPAEDAHDVMDSVHSTRHSQDSDEALSHLNPAYSSRDSSGRLLPGSERAPLSD